MKIICDCGNVCELIEENTDDWHEIDKAREGYKTVKVKDYRIMDIDAQFLFCYIICRKCKIKIAIST